MQWKRRHCPALKLCLFIAILVFSSYPVSADSAPNIVWTAADMLPFVDGVSVYRYADFGLGAYPWRQSLPGAIIRVRIDGAPLYGLSPFGIDLENVPAAFIDSLVYEPQGVISLRTRTHEPEEPETVTDFFQGAKQQFCFQGTFMRKLSEQSSIFIGGSSGGIHGSRETEAAASRNYIMKYQRAIVTGGKLFFSARSSMDRDGLRDIVRAIHMGSRETDMITLTSGIYGLPLTERTTVTPLVYYQSGISRFERDSVGKSLDDDGFGFSFDASSQFDSGLLALKVSSDVRVIDSQIHGESWQRDDSRLSVSWEKTAGRCGYNLSGGIVHSSHFGTGGNYGGYLTVRMVPSLALSFRGTHTDEFPDAGIEFYPALVFSDSSLVPHLSMFRYREFESGLTGYHKALTWGIFGFYSGGRLPVFNRETTLCSTGSDETFSGARLFLSLDRDKRYYAQFRAYHCNPSDTRRFNPYPQFECVSHTGMVRKFIGEKLESAIYGSLRVSGWDGPMTPDKTALFLDVGTSLTVMNLLFFINVQNLTGEDVNWFDTYGWPDINTVWGIRLKLDN